MLENSPNYVIPLPNKTDEETDVADSLAAGITIIDTELKNRKDELDTHKTASGAHDSVNIKHGDGNVRDTIFEVNSRLTTAETDIEDVDSRISTIVAQAGTENTEIVDARGGFTVLRDRFENVEDRFTRFAESITTIYVSPTGDDTLGGTTLGTALATLQKAFDVISQTYLVIKGTIKIDLLEGTYAQVSSFPANIRSNERIQIIGKKDESGIPTVIFDGDGLTGSGIFANERAYLLVQDIKFQNYRNSGQTAAGIHVQHYANLFTDNVHILNCDWGISATSSRLYTKGGIVSGCLYGVKMYSNSLGTIGYTAGGFGLGTVVKNCTNAGIHLQNQCSAHTDFCVVDGNRDGVVCVNQSRVHALECDIKNQTGIGVKLYQGSTWFNDNNTFTNNVKNWSHLSFSTELTLHQDAKASLLTTLDVDAATLTGNTALTQIKSGTIVPQNAFISKGRKIRVKAFGTFTGAGTKTVQVRVSPGGLVLGFTSVNLTGNWEIDISIYALGTASQKVFGKFTEDDGTTRKAQLSRITKTYDFAVQETCSVWGQLADSAGSIVVDVLEIEEVI